MKKLLIIVLLVSICGLAQSSNSANDSSVTASGGARTPELETFYMALFRRVAPYDPASAQQIGLQQRDYWQAVADRGDLMLGGSIVGAKDDLVGAVIYRAKNAEEATKLVQRDPAVSAHSWSVEVHPWMTMK